MEHIEARMIVEIMGRPAEHVTSTLNLLADKIGSEQGVKLKDKKIHEPIPVKDSKDLFSTFAELEVEFDSVVSCFRVVFAYLPSNFEIISPESIKMKNEDITTLANAISARLHDYDAIAKRLVAEREMLVNKLKTLEPETPAKKDKKVNSSKDQ